MKVLDYIKQKKDFCQKLLSYLDKDSNDEDKKDYLNLAKDINKIIQDSTREELTVYIQIISKISENHHRNSCFNQKIDKILFLFNDKIKQTFSNSELFNFFKDNKRILLSLFKQQVIVPDSSIAEYFHQKSDNLTKISSDDKTVFTGYELYFYPEIEPFLENESKEKIEEYLLNKDPNYKEEFDTKRQIGENDSRVCSIIRKNILDEFIQFYHQTNIRLDTIIQPSIYETNPYLTDKKHSLIEYAIFHGSYQIVHYLQINHIELSEEMWGYAIHSNDPEIITLLEENNIASDTKFKLTESIKCHHNETAFFLLDNKNEDIKAQENACPFDIFKSSYLSVNFSSFNFVTIPDDIDLQMMFFFACKFDYFQLVKLLVENKDIDINKKMKDERGALNIALTEHHQEIFNYLFSQPNIEITDKCFFQCKELVDIIIPPSITKIGNLAFYGCENLKKVSIPTSVTIIGNGAFKGCELLTELVVPSSVTTIGDNAFEGCKSITVFVVPSSITKIGKGVFKECESLQRIEIPSTITIIDDLAFADCELLEQIIIPSSVKTIGNHAFASCMNLKNITIPSSVTSLGKGVFSRMVSDAKWFKVCSSLESVKFENPCHITSLSSCLFNSCRKLKDFTFPPSVTEICDNAFKDCSSITNLIIPSIITKIDKYAFAGTSIVEISLPPSITLIDSYTFSRCEKLQKILIPSSVTYIGYYAFFSCRSLKEISLPSSITIMKKYAFYECSSLEKIDLSSSLESIESFTFINCKSLKQISIPPSVKSIGANAFEESLAQIELPSSLNIDFKSAGFADNIVVKRI